MGSSTSALAGFNGTSKYAASLQQTLTRALGIAALPINLLSASETKLTDRQSALQSLDARFSVLQASLSTIQNTVQSGVLNSSVSDGGIVSVSLATGASAGTYSIEVGSLGSYSSALSVAGATVVTDPGTGTLSGSHSFSVTAGGITTPVTSPSASLRDIASAINLQAGSQVQASIVNVGSNASPDYRISVRAVKLGSSSIALSDGNLNNLISTSTNGTLASYQINGSSAVQSDSRNVTLAPGVAANLLGESADGTPVTVTVHQDASVLASAFSSFAQSYNSAVSTIGQYHGSKGGVLQGDHLLSSLSGILRQLGGYDAGTPETALANYGITLDKDGRLSVDSTALAAAANQNFPRFLSVLGDTKTGGFLKIASDLLDSAVDTNNGSVTTTEASVAKQITDLQDKISDRQDRLTQLQQNLTQQLAEADTAIARLESQVSYVNGLFYSITGNNNGTNNNP